MLRIALVLLGLAMLFGFVLAVMNARPSDKPPPVLARVAHGALGAAGLAALLVTLREPAHGLAEGGSTFRTDAVVLLCAALLMGLGILAAFRVAPKTAGAVMGLHATIAMFGLAILAAYASFG